MGGASVTIGFLGGAFVAFFVLLIFPYLGFDLDISVADRCGGRGVLCLGRRVVGAVLVLSLDMAVVVVSVGILGFLVVFGISAEIRMFHSY